MDKQGSGSILLLVQQTVMAKLKLVWQNDALATTFGAACTTPAT